MKLNQESGGFGADPNEDDDLPIKPKSILQPMASNSRAIRYRVMMLFGCLLMVIFAMKEAGKPKNWEWMNFPESVSENGNDSGDASTGVDHTDAPPVVINKAASDSAEQDLEANDDVVSQDTLDDSAPTFALASNQSTGDYPAAAVRFWESLFQELSSNQQKKFLLLLKSMRTGQKLDASETSSYSKLVMVIASQREKFHQELFDRVTLTPEDAPGKKRKSEELYESTELWDNTILPAMSAAAIGQDFTISQQQAIKRLQMAIDPLVFSQVSDQTSIGWTGDSEAWKRIWEKTLEQGERQSSKSEPVDRIALMSQPEFYRGKPVQIKGWIRSIRRKSVSADSQLELNHYYEMWVRPKESKLGTFCVYSATLPKGSKLLQETFNASGKNDQHDQTNFIDANENVTIEGHFFKVRTYVAADTTVRGCPVVLASSFESIAPVEFAANSWQPSRTTLSVFLISIPILATAIACWVYFSSRTKQYVPGKQRTKMINKTLSALATDPSVQTDSEKIMSLYETEMDTNDA